MSVRMTRLPGSLTALVGGAISGARAGVCCSSRAYLRAAAVDAIRKAMSEGTYPLDIVMKGTIRG